jgi:class 3 adenylate cyclase
MNNRKNGAGLGPESASIEFASDASFSLESDDQEEMDKIAVRESRWICCLRTFAILLSVASCIVAAYVVFRLTSSKEEEDFETSYETQAYELLSSWETHSELQIGALEMIALSFTSYASDRNREWPSVTLPDFAYKAATFRDLTGSQALGMMPVVTVENRRLWEGYTEVNAGEWIQEGLRAENRTDLPISRRSLQPSQKDVRNLQQDDNAPSFSNGVSVDIFNVQEIKNEGISLTFPQTETSDGPYYPMWQHSPVARGLVNFNMISQPEFRTSMEACVDSEKAVLGPAADLSDNGFWAQTVLGHWEDESEVSPEPFSLIWFPIFDGFHTSNDRMLVGMVSAISYWSRFFADVLNDEARELNIVIQSDCGQTITYHVNGPNITFYGYGDFHDPNYDDFEISHVVAIERKGTQFNSEFCPHTIRVYPSDATQDYYTTKNPRIYTLVVVIIFMFGFLIFIAYDVIVELRQRRVMKTANENRAVVASLFPAAIRERMFSKRKSYAESEDFVDGFEIIPNADGTLTAAPQEQSPTDPLNATQQKDAKDPSTRIRNFLSENEGRKSKDEKPIADLFPNTTVMFADIAGFTAWSSQREPIQVFTLLQKVYQSFDKIAKKLGVFKVETIGDCYVAVTGLPDPQKDHAVRMARFARECVYKMQEVVSKLEITLGPDTGDLCMRVGLHSGPVTAGVLRGEKSRFQLFGDTVNTAARMESTGIKNQIQCSTISAELLHAAGKGAWLSERKDVVVAKGKGEMKTFWIETRQLANSSHHLGSEKSANAGTDASHTGHDDDSDSDSDPQSRRNSFASAGGESGADSTEPLKREPASLKAKGRRRNSIEDGRRLRLVGWHVDLLGRLLKAVVAQRQVKSVPIPDTRPKWEWGGRQVADEVAEFISFPDVDSSASYVDPESIQLSSDVLSQLRNYVTTLASMYRGNSFHNFEHASHVTMCTNKLFNRILTGKTSGADDVLAYTSRITSSALTQFAVVLSAVIHDVDHIGVSNLDLIKQESELVELYGKKSMAEQNSVDLAWELLMDPAYEDLQQCIYHDQQEFDFFRQVVVNMVLATDIFEKDAKAFRQRRWDQAFGGVQSSLSDDDLQNLRATVILEHTIQASDVGHTMQHWQIYSTWNEKLFEEMATAFQRKTSTNDPVGGWYEGEIMFFDFYILPLAEKLLGSGAYGAIANEYLDYAIQNRAEWAAKGSDKVRVMASKYYKKRLLSAMLDNAPKRDAEEDIDNRSGYCSAA